MNFFKDIKIGNYFISQGQNLCKKQSTRTALLVKYGRWFYFSKTELCKKVKVL